AKYGIYFNTLTLGYFRTPLNKTLSEDPDFTDWLEKHTPAGRLGKVEELVDTAVYLSSDAASFLKRQMIFVDGGLISRV
ncbi:MAG: SDR family oxidoreductase, partial [Rhodobacterales bacterium]